MSDIGRFRPNNEDCITSRLFVRKADSICMGVVCDGVGGTECGEYASGTAVAELEKWFGELSEANDDRLEFDALTQSFKKKIYDINDMICRYSKVNQIQTGSTLSGIIFVGNRYLTVNVGDSRVYLINSKVTQMTSDDVVLRETASGIKTALSQCIGGSSNIFINTVSGEAKKGEVFFFCSDGFYKLIKNSDMKCAAMKIGRKTEASVICSKLINIVIKRGEKDNISVGYIKCL